MARDGWQLVPEVRGDVVHVVVRRRWIRGTSRTRTDVRADRRRGRRRGRARRDGPRPASTRSRSARGRRASQPPPPAAMTDLMAAPRRALPPGRAPDPRRRCGYARYAEERGFEAVWQAESRLVREATVPLAAFGAVTERIKLGSGVVSMWVRNPAFLAATFSTLDDLAPGRVILGIGAWWDPLAREGRRRSRRSRCGRCARSSTAVRALLANETVTFDGEFVHLDGVELDYVHQERRPKDVPIVHRRHRHADDGARGRDRRRRAAQLPRVAGVQRDRARAPRGGRGQGGSRCSTTSTGRSSSCARWTTTAAARSTPPGSSSRSTSGSSRTS